MIEINRQGPLGWIDIVGYEGLYMCNAFGDVIRIDTGRIKRINIGRFREINSYVQVILSSKGVGRAKYLHRAIAEAWLPNPRGLEEVNHIDGDKWNNKVSNLEWISHKDNVAHAFALCLNSKDDQGRPVTQMNKLGVVIKEWPSAKRAGEALGINAVNITGGCLGRPGRYNVGGYKWRYTEDYSDVEKEEIPGFPGYFASRK